MARPKPLPVLLHVRKQNSSSSLIRNQEINRGKSFKCLAWDTPMLMTFYDTNILITLAVKINQQVRLYISTIYNMSSGVVSDIQVLVKGGLYVRYNTDEKWLKLKQF